MTPEEMKQRTKKFALRVIGLVDALPKDHAANVIGRQLLRAGTSVGSNYLAACRARSQAEFIAKLGIVEEEADESIYWMELLTEGGLMQRKRLSPLMKEAGELLAIVVSSINTARGDSRGAGGRESAIRNPQSAMGPPQASGMARNHG
ncbi:MAG TPA: four helix bundle protein [Phycisphaerae bacterium]|nr:four helix bundle protein [Phycisphaerae bacterium]